MKQNRSARSSKDVLGIALIGLDHWYTALPLARSIAESPLVELVALWDRDESRAREVGSTVHTDVAKDWESILGRDDVDAIASFVTVDENAHIVAAAARQGKHVICVKPVAMKTSEVDFIASAAASTGVVIFPMEGYYRLTPHCGKLKELISQGVIGDVLTISITGRAGVPQCWPDVDSPGWYGDPTKVPGGAWLDHGIYQLAFLRWLLGAEPRRVRGLVATLGNSQISNEDYGLAIYEFSDGTMVSMEETWTMPRGMYYSQTDIVGTEGMLSYSNRDNSIWVARNGHPWVKERFDRTDVDYLRHFIDCVKGNARPICTIHDARVNLAASLAFYEASRLGTEVAIT